MKKNEDTEVSVNNQKVNTHLLTEENDTKFHTVKHQSNLKETKSEGIFSTKPRESLQAPLGSNHKVHFIYRSGTESYVS